VSRQNHKENVFVLRVRACVFVFGWDGEKGNLTRMGKFTIGVEFRNVRFVHAGRL